MVESGLEQIATALARSLNAAVAPAPERVVHGGSIHACYRWPSAAGVLFVKVASAADAWLLEAEADGLRELARAAAVRVPHVRTSGTAAGRSYLALEWIEPQRPREAGAQLGARLAAQHRITAERHGWTRDTAIGRTLQVNTPTTDWVEFWRDRRLGFQLALAAQRGYGGRLQSRGAQLLERLPALLQHRPAASLLHGDLWGGNWGAGPHDEPVIYDPALYYGDREADLAMTHLFGGFPPEFHSAYREAWPLPPEAAARLPLYTLYHVLNHANLFGGHYAREAERLMDGLLAELGH